MRAPGEARGRCFCFEGPGPELSKGRCFCFEGPGPGPSKGVREGPLTEKSNPDGPRNTAHIHIPGGDARCSQRTTISTGLGGEEEKSAHKNAGEKRYG